MVIGMSAPTTFTPTPAPKPLSRKREREGPVAQQREGEGAPAAATKAGAAAPKKVPETGGPEGPEPTRYGDWERKGRCIDF
jgi:hypothetical protein